MDPLRRFYQHSSAIQERNHSIFFTQACSFPDSFLISLSFGCTNDLLKTQDCRQIISLVIGCSLMRNTQETATPSSPRRRCFSPPATC